MYLNIEKVGIFQQARNFNKVGISLIVGNNTLLTR